MSSTHVSCILHFHYVLVHSSSLPLLYSLSRRQSVQVLKTLFTCIIALQPLHSTPLRSLDWHSHLLKRMLLNCNFHESLLDYNAQKTCQLRKLLTPHTDIQSIKFSLLLAWNISFLFVIKIFSGHLWIILLRIIRVLL